MGNINIIPGDDLLNCYENYCYTDDIGQPLPVACSCVLL